ncbi:MAG TPA: DUF2007 domain-containing protein, partial [Candidatus Goldiibacteriota bacterium]|nr:DUF2007 domain-containing protein [Candidatus Goldiibacteriota bacterium]
EGTMPDIETAELTQVEDEIEAGIIRGMLEEAGIFSFLKVNVLLNTNLIMGGIFGRRKFGSVIINKEDMEKAKAVLDDFKKSR